jgi:hypothetical protein
MQLENLKIHGENLKMARRGSSGMRADSVNAKESVGRGFKSQPKR